MSVPSKKRRADRRCCFIDDEALEDHNKDNQEDSEEEEEEDNQESDEEEEEQDDVKDNNDIDLDFNNHNNDFEFNGVDVSSNQHIPPLFESSSESVNDKCDDDSQQTHDQQVADDESLNPLPFLVGLLGLISTWKFLISFQEPPSPFLIPPIYLIDFRLRTAQHCQNRNSTISFVTSYAKTTCTWAFPSR